MANSSRLNWPYPNENSQSWYEQFKSLVDAQDASGYASREDRQIILGGGGALTWTAGVFTWASPFILFSPISGFQLTVAVGSISLNAGECLYVNLVRAPGSSSAIIANKAANVPNTDVSYIIAIRSVNDLYIRNGAKFASGETGTVAGPGAGSGPTIITTTNDPSVYGLAGPVGSIAVATGIPSSSNGVSFLKYGSLNTDWFQINNRFLDIYVDPTIAGIVAPVTSLAVRDNGVMYYKYGAGNTNWWAIGEGIMGNTFSPGRGAIAIDLVTNPGFCAYSFQGVATPVGNADATYSATGISSTVQGGWFAANRANALMFAPTGLISISGLQGGPGVMARILNESETTGVVTLLHNDAGTADVTSRFYLPNNVNLSIPPRGSVWIENISYGISHPAGWRVVGKF